MLRLSILTIAIVIAVVLFSDSGPSADQLPTAVASPFRQETELSDREAIQLMTTLTNTTDPGEALTALDRIVESGDSRFIAVLIELMRANQIGIVFAGGYQAHANVLQDLSGQTFGFDWPAWVEWYGGTDLVPPPGFTGWKGGLLGRIDPGFNDFLRDDAPSRIRTEEVQFGGVVVDGIPALDHAAMIASAEADYLLEREPVFGIEISGDARAYPLRILDWHEMANDTVGGVPVSLAYCTLCGSAIAYDGRASDGNTYTFGSSGFLYRSNKLMYDRQTRTLWNQLTGEPVLGRLAATDVRLDLLPVVLTSWDEWQSRHPDTLVLDLNTGYNRSYVPGAAYGDYFASPDTMFPVWQRSSRLPAKTRIYALQVEGVPKAYPVELLVQEEVVNDAVGQTDLVLLSPGDTLTVDGMSLRIGPVSYEAGVEVRAYRTDGTRFRSGSDGSTVLDEQGNPWQISEDALIGPGGKSAPRISGHLAYWFGWYSFFPQTLVYEGISD
jgi:hypothetical protein